MKRAGLLEIVLALALAGSADASVPVKKLSLRSTSASSILKRGALTVRVTTRRKGRVRVRAGTLAHARTLRFKRRGRKTVRLKLTARGRKTLRGCGARRRVTVRAGRKKLSRLVRRKRCASSPPASSPPPAGGDAIRVEPAGFDTPAGCDFFDPAVCLQPWPNDYFTVADKGTATGRRLHLTAGAMPKNVAGKAIQPGDYNRNDGFSPGSPIHTKIPGLDNQAAFNRTGLVPETDIARSFDPGQPAVVIDADSGERQLIWAELDAQAGSDADRNLFIRPGRNFREGHRYIVALRHLERADGSTIEPQRPFRVYRDRIYTTSTAVEARRAHMEDLFAALGRAGIERGDLYLAWDFTVGSATSIAGRSVPGVCPPGDPTEHPPDPEITRVCGTFTVPCFLASPTCATGSRFQFADATSNAPVATAGATMLADYDCIMPTATTGDPLRMALYGHGLLGDASEVDLAPQRSMVKRHGFAYCATDWKGMATEDDPNVALILNDFSRFPSLTDRVQQGILDFIFLGRLMKKGFPSDPRFAGRLDTAHLFYDGNSQGGIYSGTLTAVSPDIERAALGVPGMNYSTLLQRSTDFSQYATVMNASYPDELQRPLLFSLIQQLWDRSDPDGYAWHITADPYPGTPAHTVLMQSAVGDHQVANVAADVEARTIGAKIRANPVDPGRSLDADPFYGIGTTGFPSSGSVYEPWDAGAGFNALAPAANTPPVESDSNQDPHGVPRRTAAAQDQKSDHLKAGGTITDHCAGGPCHSVP